MTRMITDRDVERIILMLQTKNPTIKEETKDHISKDEFMHRAYTSSICYEYTLDSADRLTKIDDTVKRNEIFYIDAHFDAKQETSEFGDVQIVLTTKINDVVLSGCTSVYNWDPDYSSKLIDKRIVGDIIIPMKNVNKDIIGFQNRGSIIENNNYPLFDNDYTLGINYKNFYGTYILGPILVRNPELNKYLINNNLSLD